MARQEGSSPPSPNKKLQDILDKQGMPSNLEAERALLGAVLINNNLADEVLESLADQDFSSPANQRIFRAIGRLKLENQEIDPVTLTERLHRSGELEAAGGAEYISDLTTGMPPLSTAEHYTKIIKERALLRELIIRANRIIVDAYTSSDDPRQVLAKSEQSILEVGSQHIKTSMVGMEDLAKESMKTLQLLLESKQKVTGVPTKFLFLDEMTSGFQSTDLVIIAARPSVGKTAFALSIALQAAKEGNTVAFFSLEMSAEQIFFRLLSMESKVDLQKIRHGKILPAKQAEVGMCVDRLATLPIYIDDSPTLTQLDMGAKLRRLKSQRGLNMIVVDYLQLMSGVGRFENRTQEVSSISRGLKSMAKELGVPLVALSQLSRAPEKRGEGKEPILSDLRDSGSIEQDADLVLFLHRDVAGKDDPATRGHAKVIIAKQRNGPVGSVDLTFLPHVAQFANYIPEEV